MAADLVYFDLETRRTANDVGGWDKKQDMGISVGVTYSTRLGQYRIFTEEKVQDLIDQLRRADLVIGFNVIDFDYAVLMGHTILDLKQELRTFDLLTDVERRIGRKIKLDALASATLGVGKTGDGLDAIRWWREGKMMEIAEYCCFDVKVTRMLHEHGVEHGQVSYDDKFSRRQTIDVDWGKAGAGDR
jgi:hypothetical protein